MYEVTTASSSDHIFGIHSLQKLNLKVSLSDEEIDSQGFVTCDHTVELLTAMNSPYPHIIALDDQDIAGYALVMLESFRNDIPVLKSMFETMDDLQYRGKNLKNAHYFVMGQVCVAKDHRSQGLFDKMYSHLKETMRRHFDYCITEIATDNLRSRKAHSRVGFSELHSYIDSQSGQSWELVIWDWTDQVL